MTLTPELTQLDQRVLEAVSRPRQITDLAYDLSPEFRRLWARPYRGDACEREKLTSEILSILRGLEHLGYVHRKRGGWWQAKGAVSNPQVKGEICPQVGVET